MARQNVCTVAVGNAVMVLMLRYPVVNGPTRFKGCVLNDVNVHEVYLITKALYSKKMLVNLQGNLCISGR